MIMPQSPQIKQANAFYFQLRSPLALQFSEMIIALLRNQIGRKSKCATSTFGHIMSLVSVASRISA